ncbi:hypothetical protein ACFSCW_00955 [Sphingomonas tabacisoli]|uniref:Transferrin-binding protein B C-lobe/N-lobe beta barrel domain-containing protein n=1 Tax=Sphingomonas tabacisoli TaxID=2249466 RepID=A0ABW4HXK7_9SPHN
MVYSQTFDATGARTAATLQADKTTTGQTALANGFGSGVSLSYDATTQGYTVRDASGASATFLPATKSSDPNETNAKITTFNQAAGGGQDKLVLFNPGAGNTTLALSYVSYGAWRHSVSNGTTADLSFQYFVYGIRQDANAPSTGSGSYATTVEGIWNNPEGIYVLAGTSSLTADFTAKTVATTLQLDGTSVANGTAKSLGRFDGTGSIAALGGGFAGNFTHVGTDADGNVFNGSFAGAFFGPQGQEVGYTFSLSDPNGRGGTAAGAVVGKAN